MPQPAAPTAGPPAPARQATREARQVRQAAPQEAMRGPWTRSPTAIIRKSIPPQSADPQAKRAGSARARCRLVAARAAWPAASAAGINSEAAPSRRYRRQRVLRRTAPGTRAPRWRRIPIRPALAVVPDRTARREGSRPRRSPGVANAIPGRPRASRGTGQARPVDRANHRGCTGGSPRDCIITSLVLERSFHGISFGTRPSCWNCWQFFEQWTGDQLSTEQVPI